MQPYKSTILTWSNVAWYSTQSKTQIMQADFELEKRTQNIHQATHLFLLQV